jgi:cytochrome c
MSADRQSGRPAWASFGLFRRIVAAWLLFGCVALVSALTASAQAPEGEELAGAKRCFACHDMDTVLLGPPYRAIAARHAGERDLMTDVLAQKIIHGGAGNWGVVPMVPNEHVSLSEARAISQWILSLND